MSKMEQKFRGWCFTQFDMGQKFEKDKFNWKYIIIGLETCPTTGNKHYQGYIYFKSPRYFKGVQKLLPGAHLEPSKGDADHNKKYCSKENIYLEDGEKPEQGKRNDLTAISEELKDKKISEIAMEYPETFVRYRGGLKELRNFHLEKKFNNTYRNVTGYLIIGDAGIGKSRYVYDKHGYENVFVPRISGDKVWFDKYDGEDVLLLDDYYGDISWGYFLRLTDGHPVNIEIKGGMTVACWTHIYITSNTMPFKWGKEYKTPEFKRRFQKCVEIGSNVLEHKCSEVILDSEHSNIFKNFKH